MSRITDPIARRPQALNARELGQELLNTLSNNTTQRALELIKQGAHFLSIQNSHGNTALHWAVSNGHTEIVEALINALPKEERAHFLSIQNSHGNTALHLAALYRHTEIVEALINALPKEERAHFLSIRNNYGNTALHDAAYLGKTETEIVEVLVQHGANINEISDQLGRHRSLREAAAIGLIKRALAPEIKYIKQDGVENGFFILANNLYDRNNPSGSRLAFENPKLDYDVKGLLGNLEDPYTINILKDYLDEKYGMNKKNISATEKEELINFVLKELGGLDGISL